MSVVPLRKRHTPVTRGDHMPTIVKTYQLGNTTVHICSDFFPKTEDERQKRHQELTDVGWRVWDSLSEQEQLELNAEYEKERKTV